MQNAAMANANLIIIMRTNLKTYVDSQLENAAMMMMILTIIETSSTLFIHLLLLLCEE
jgi:hypothetical protein